MCLEDLRLGKGRFPGPFAVTGVIGSVQPVLAADARRVAIILSFTGTSLIDTLNNVIEHPSASWIFGTKNGIAFTIVMNENSSPITLRIEDHGQLVMQEVNVFLTDPTGQGVTAVAQAILSTVNVEPIAHIPAVQGR